MNNILTPPEKALFELLDRVEMEASSFVRDSANPRKKTGIHEGLYPPYSSELQNHFTGIKAILRARVFDRFAELGTSDQIKQLVSGHEQGSVTNFSVKVDYDVTNESTARRELNYGTSDGTVVGKLKGKKDSLGRDYDFED